MDVSLLPGARKDLKTIRDYLHFANPDAATGTVGRILDAVERLAGFPVIGRSGRLPGTREFSVAGLPYACIYRVDSDRIEIAAIVHTRHHWP